MHAPAARLEDRWNMRAELREQLAKLTGGAVPSTDAPATSATSAGAPVAASRTPENANFDALVDQVEESLKNPGAPTASTSAANATATARSSIEGGEAPVENDNPAASLAAGETTTNEKTEEQLQADFEKMLNS